MAENLIITRTKIVTPQRRKDYLTRPRLLELVSDLFDFRLIIVAAPAGYGKTTLLVDFAHQFNWPVCWLALEPIDQDLNRFLSHFVYSIKQKFPDFGSDAINLLETTPSDQINLDFLITTITNDIFEKITEHFIIVLDDYHLLKSSPKIDQFLSDFVQRADENCHVVITSRKLLTLPDLPLMVARSQVGGLSVEELAFQPDEILKLFNQLFNQPITSQQAKDLAANTEGWITGLLLTSQTLGKGMGEARKVARASGIGLYEYLAQQVLDQQPQHIQDFLLNTSLLEEFNEDLCEVVVGKALSQKANWNALMDHVIQNNLFIIPVSEKSLWLRYHHLFRDFLQAAIQKNRPEDAYKIKLELARYFKENGNWEKVFEIYESLGEKEAIAELVGSIGSEFIAKGKMQKLSSWISIIPKNIYENDPRLLSIHASVAVNQGKVQEGRELLDRVVELLRVESDSLSLADNLIRRSSALRVLGNYKDAMYDADEAISLTQKKPSLNHLYSEALRAKGIILYQKGKLREGLIFLEKAIHLCDETQREEDTARILVEVGAVHETLGQITEAEQAYTRSLAYWQSVGDSIWQPTILNNLGVLQHTKGDFVKSFINLEKSMHYSQATGNQRMEGYSLEIALIIEDQFLVFYLKTVQSRLSVNNNQFKKAQLQIRGAQTIAKKSGSLYEINKYRLEQGVLDFCTANYDKAIENLLMSEDFFKKEGHIEDTVRNQFYLFLSFIKVGELERSNQILDDIMKKLPEPQQYIPTMSAANDVKNVLKPLTKKKVIGVKISKLFEEVDQFQKLIQKSRRIIRKQASVVPFAPAKIIIRTFGSIEVIVNNRTLKISNWKTQTSRDLFLLFLAYPEGLTKEEVGVIFWPDASPSELKLRFKNAIYRMRHAIGSDVVNFQDNYYLFNLSLYKGAYLPPLDQTWVVTDRERYLGMFAKAAEELALLYMNNKEFEASLKISQSALKFDPYNEPIHRICMKLYAALGNKSAVSQQFNKCRTILLKEIGTEPSSQTIALYESLINE
jgi:ATP/maltotriose-dependent transcriptional regulator MalT/DNA-binding SARP family transcriptional activator